MKKFLLITENYVVSLLTKRLNKDHLFHNLSHTQHIISSIKELIKGENIIEVEANILLFASWFLHSGFVNRKENHIEASVNIATTFLEEYNIDNIIIDDVVRLIRITNQEVEAKDLLEKIMKDAAFSYYSQSSFTNKTELLRHENNLLLENNYSQLEWIQQNINSFVKEHRFYTNYAQENWQKGKDKNLAKLVKSEKKLLKIKEIDSLEVSIKVYNSLVTKGTILFFVNYLIILITLFGSYFSVINFQQQNTVSPITIIILFNVISSFLSILVAFPIFSFKNISNQEFLNQKIIFKRRMFQYSYVVMIVGVLISFVVFIMNKTTFIN